LRGVRWRSRARKLFRSRRRGGRSVRRKKYYIDAMHWSYEPPPPMQKKRAACFRKAPKHVNPHELLDNPALGAEMCPEARRSAQLAVAAVLVGLAAPGPADEAPAATPEGGDAMLSVKEAAARTGLSTSALYRDKNLPFRVQLSPGRVRFSAAGIAC
jgi:predicted DNA-binding transcriptional regulator AlpA